MTNAISKLHNALETWSFKYNCYEAVHPWTPWCSDSALDIGLTVFGEAIKLYTPLYLFSQFMQRKYDYPSFKNTSQSILRSTTFISANAFFALFFFCSSQYFTGKFYYYAVAYLPGFVASVMAVLIEKSNRRSSLAFYVANVASEALFRIYVARGYLRPINNGQVYIFTLSIATLMMLAKKHGFDEDPLSAAIKMIVGAEEANKRQRRRGQPNLAAVLVDNDERRRRHLQQTCDQESIALVSTGDNSEQVGQHPDSAAPQASSSSRNITRNNILDRVKAVYDWLKFLLTSRHRLCPHRDCSCTYYVTKASLRALIIGYLAQFGLEVSKKAGALWRSPKMIGSIATSRSTFKIGLFLSVFSGLYKGTNCWLRWSLETSKPLNCFIAGLVAGPALYIYPSPTVALYVLWKCLEALYNEAVRVGVVKNKDLYIVLLYGLATSQLFYSALMDPRYMKKSYMNFLDRISHHKLHMVNRSVLDVFGTEASSGYEDFFPDLHPRFMSRAFLGTIWIWMIDYKFVAKQLAAV